MPFDFKKYDAKCAEMGPEALQKEWEHYTRLISGAATSTTVSGLALPFTAGVSVIGVGMAAPAIHNARKKREIIERHLQRHNTTHNTRAKDVLGSMAFSGTLGVLTLGVGTAGADAIAQSGAEHGISAIVNNDTAIKVGIHAALDGAAMAGEEAHHNHKKEKEANKMIAAAQQKILMAQSQGQYQTQPGAYGQPEMVYGAVQIPGTYSNTPQETPPSYPQDIKYPVPVVAEIKYDIPPTPQYTPGPPPYSSPPPQAVSHYNPQNFAPPPTQTPGPLSPAPSVSTLSSYSGHPGQVFSPVSSVAPTPAPQPVPMYTAPTPVPHQQPQAAAQNLPPFQSHVAAPGFQTSQSQLVWSHVQNQWVCQEAAPSHPVSAPTQQPAPAASQEYGYPFPPQPVDRRASVYASAPTSAPTQSPPPVTATPDAQHYSSPAAAPQQYAVPAPVPQQYSAPTPAPQQYSPPPHTQQQYSAPPAQQHSSPLAHQQYASPPPPQQQYSAPPQQTAQPPTTTTYGYPTPAQTPGTSQPIQTSVLYFPPPPNAQTPQFTPSYTPAPTYSTPAPQYAPVATPQPHTVPHRHSIAQSTMMTPPQEQIPHYVQYQQPATRHYSLPNPTPIAGQEKLGQGWQPAFRHQSIPEQVPAAQAPQTYYAAPQPQAGVQGLCDAYGGMKI